MVNNLTISVVHYLKKKNAFSKLVAAAFGVTNAILVLVKSLPYNFRWVFEYFFLGQLL